MPVRIIDLSHPLYDGSPSWPGDPGISVAEHCTIERDTCCVHRLSLGTHQGTHIDAPAHYLKGGAGVDSLPLERLYGKARLLRIPRGRGGRIGRADLLRFDEHLQEGARLLVHTGWDEQWGKEGFFLEGPCLDLDAAKLLAERKIGVLGVDMATPAADDAEAVHHVLMNAGVIIVEGLANLGLCPDEFTLVAFPLRFEGLDGSPVRAAAICQ
ncbi:MAG: cyclase family protein [Opitutales bacterium]|nr:cyclase family protein [Opitutales bacterium]